MANPVSFKTVGNWQNKIAVSLKDVLAVSMDVCGRNGQEACAHAMIRMAMAAKAQAIQSAKFRPIHNDASRLALKAFQTTGSATLGAAKKLAGQYEYAVASRDYVNIWKQGKHEPTKLYRFMFTKKWGYKLQGTFADARRIGGRGLAKRSWTWGLGSIGGHADSSPISGASKFYTILGDKACGYVKENRIGYIQKAMPAGWENEIQSRVANVIMAQARDKIQREWLRAMGVTKVTSKHLKNLRDYYKAVAA